MVPSPNFKRRRAPRPGDAATVARVAAALSTSAPSASTTASAARLFSTQCSPGAARRYSIRRPCSMATTSLPGTWVGETRTLIGVDVGQEVQLVVGVWDAKLFGSFESAVSGKGIAGKSPAFGYKYQPSSPPATDDKWMKNFPAFKLTDYSAPVAVAAKITAPPVGGTVAYGGSASME